jgi:hypothetical protein
MPPFLESMHLQPAEMIAEGCIYLSTVDPSTVQAGLQVPMKG